MCSRSGGFGPSAAFLAFGGGAAATRPGGGPLSARFCCCREDWGGGGGGRSFATGGGGRSLKRDAAEGGRPGVDSVRARSRRGEGTSGRSSRGLSAEWRTACVRWDGEWNGREGDGDGRDDEEGDGEGEGDGRCREIECATVCARVGI